MLRRIPFSAFILVILIALVVWPGATRGQAEPSEDRTVVAALFASKFCASCRILEPRLSSVLPDYESRPLDYVKLDQTLSLVTGSRIEALAERHGISGVYDSLKGGTGFLALVDPRDEQVIEIVTIRYSEDDIRAALDRALMTVNAREIG